MGATVAVREQAGQHVAGRRAETDAAVLALWLQGRPANTARAYRREAVQFFAFVGAPLPVITLGDVKAYGEHLQAAGLAPASQARAIAALKSLLSFANTVGYTAANVGAAERLPAVKLTLAERIAPAETIAQVIAAEPNARNRALLRVLYYGGLRVSEACGLYWRDVVARNGGALQLTVFGKGAKTRAVLLPAHAAADVLALRDGAAAGAPVFAGRGGALTPGRAWQIVQAAGKRAGVPALSPHWLRHACASHALEAGATPALVRDTLGHSSLAVTSRYLHARPDDSAGLYLPTV